MKRPGRGSVQGCKATRRCGTTAAHLASASVPSEAEALGLVAAAPNTTVREDENEGGPCVTPCRAGLCKRAAGTPAVWE